MFFLALVVSSRLPNPILQVLDSMEHVLRGLESKKFVFQGYFTCWTQKNMCCICAVNDMLYRDAICCSFPHSSPPPSSPYLNWAPGPPCHVRGVGEGPPPHKSPATSQPPMIGNPMCRLKWFYHPYTLTTQNDRLDEKT